MKDNCSETPIDKAIQRHSDELVQLLLMSCVEYDSNTTNKKYKDLVNIIFLLNTKN